MNNELLADLNLKRSEAATKVAEAEQQVRVWTKVLAVLDHQIMELTAPSKGRQRQPRGFGEAAIATIYRLLDANRGRRYTTAELEAATGGAKVRRVVWLQQQSAVQRGQERIEIEGGNRNRTYFLP